MGFTKTAVYFTLALLATAAVVPSSATFISPLCITADDKVLCSQLISGGRIWRKAMMNALKDVLEKVKAGRSVVDTVGSKLPADLKPQTKESIEKTCAEAYDTVIDNLKQSIEFVKSDPDSSLKVYLSAATFSDCTDGLAEFGVKLPETTQFDDEVLKLTDALLALAERRP